MPTGYTAKLYDGEQDFVDFVLGAARGMGALITMRDDAPDATIPDEFIPSDYHTNGLKAARDRKNAALAWTPEEAQQHAEEASAAAAAADAAYKAQRVAVVARYQAMVERVEAWDCPDDLLSFKAFMLDQLRESIRFDGPKTLPSLSRPVAADGRAYREQEVQQANRAIEYHLENYEAEVQRCAERTAWVRALKDSLGLARV